MPTAPFPEPQPGDPEDVAWTLQTAGTMWARGDVHEAVRWLRRAAEAAGDSGHDMRAVMLAKTAADLTAELQLPPSIPPPAPSPDETSRMVVPPVSRPDNPRPIQPLDDADGPYAESDYTIPEGLHAVEDRVQRPPLPRSVPKNPPPSSRPRPPSAAPPAIQLRPRQALRVAVEPSANDKNLLLVRPLAEDEPVPPNAHEAILTALEPGQHLLSRKR